MRAAMCLRAAALLLPLAGISAARADSLVAVFSNPINAGTVLNDPVVGDISYIDNTGTAPATTITSGNGSLLQWGSDPGTTIPANEQYSQLSFSGASNVSVTSASPQILGSLTFLNGTSALNTLIFGATVSFYLNSVSAGNLVASDTVYITTTSNQYGGTGLTQQQLQTDADYVNICGNSSNICNSSIEAFEDSEGGLGLTVDLYGTITGDPQLALTSVQVAPGQDPSTSGAVGNLPAASVPEPRSITIFAAAVLAFGFLRRKRFKNVLF